MPLTRAQMLRNRERAASGAHAGDADRAVNRPEIDRAVGLHAIETVDQVIVGETAQPGGRGVGIGGRAAVSAGRSARIVKSSPVLIGSFGAADIVGDFDQQHVGRLDSIVGNDAFCSSRGTSEQAEWANGSKSCFSGVVQPTTPSIQQASANPANVPEGGNRIHGCLVLECCAPSPPSKMWRSLSEIGCENRKTLTVGWLATAVSNFERDLGIASRANSRSGRASRAERARIRQSPFDRVTMHRLFSCHV